MAWSKRPAGTAHTCGGPKFGRLTDGCPRCGELAAGAQARSWGPARAPQAAARAAAGAAPLGGAKHRSGGCGPVCTFGEW